MEKDLRLFENIRLRGVDKPFEIQLFHAANRKQKFLLTVKAAIISLIKRREKRYIKRV